MQHLQYQAFQHREDAQLQQDQHCKNRPPRTRLYFGPCYSRCCNQQQLDQRQPARPKLEDQRTYMFLKISKYDQLLRIF
jgi:hypothetical protein